MLFCALFKWQPWITRLDLPFFVISIPSIVCFLRMIFAHEESKAKYFFCFLLIALVSYLMLTFAIKDRLIFYVLLLLSLITYFTVVKKIIFKNFYLGITVFSAFIFAFPYVYFSKTKPLLKNPELLFAPRELKFFRGNNKQRADYVSMADTLIRYKVKNIWLMSLRSMHEYWFWVVFRNRLGDSIIIKHLNTNLILAKKINLSRYDFDNCSDSEYFAIIACYIDNALDYFKKDEIVFWQKFGEVDCAVEECKDVMFIIVLRNKSFIKNKKVINNKKCDYQQGLLQ